MLTLLARDLSKCAFRAISACVVAVLMLFDFRYARVNLVACPEGAKGVAAALQKEGYAAKV